MRNNQTIERVRDKWRSVVCCAASAAMVVLSSTALAFPISYTFTGTATGVIGTTSFSDAAFAVEVLGDTNARINTSFGWINPVSGTITVGGIGKSTITEPVAMRTACSVVGTVGLERSDGGPFPHFFFSGREIPIEVCPLRESPRIENLSWTAGPEMNLATTRGTLSLTAVGPLTYQAQPLAPPLSEAEFVQQGPKLFSQDSVEPEGQGVAVALSADGNTALVGTVSAEATYVFVRAGGVWVQQGPKLVGSGGIGRGTQGTAVALSGDGNTAIVGGEYDNAGVGAAWVFTRDAGVWSQQGPKLVGDGAVGDAHQGHAVALASDGSTVLIGGPTDDPSTLAGAAWVFTRSAGVWSQQGAKLIGTGTVGGSNQGRAVALSADGNTAIVGGELDNNFTGATWVFTRNGGIWTQQGGKLVGTDTLGTFAQQGTSISLSSDGNTAVVGGPANNSFEGAAWVFVRESGVWTQQGPRLVGAGAVGQAMQGTGVSISGDGNIAIVGGSADNPNVGAAWMFARHSNVWTQLGSKLVGSGWQGSSLQGAAVALSADGKTAIVGGFDDNYAVGAAWVYTAVAPAQIVYRALAPCRLMDTRYSTPASEVYGPVIGNTLYRLPGLLEAGQTWGQYGGAYTDCGLSNPPGHVIKALALVTTILNPNYDSYLGMGDVNDLTATLSTVALNFSRGQGLSTMSLVPQLSSNSVYFALPAQVSAQMIIDVVGYQVVADATPLQCTSQAGATVSIASSGGTGIATSPGCGLGYTLTSGACDGAFGLALTKHAVSSGSGTWLCAATNLGTAPANLTATATCCRVGGK